MLLANLFAGITCCLIWMYREEKHSEYMEAIAILDEIEMEFN